jgi:hypothetical protein
MKCRWRAAMRRAIRVASSLRYTRRPSKRPPTRVSRERRFKPEQATMPCPPARRMRSIQAAIAPSHGQRSSSDSGIPPCMIPLSILSMLATGWNPSLSATGQGVPQAATRPSSCRIRKPHEDDDNGVRSLPLDHGPSLADRLGLGTAWDCLGLLGPRWASGDLPGPPWSAGSERQNHSTVGLGPRPLQRRRRADPDGSSPRALAGQLRGKGDAGWEGGGWRRPTMEPQAMGWH